MRLKLTRKFFFHYYQHCEFNIFACFFSTLYNKIDFAEIGFIMQLQYVILH